MWGEAPSRAEKAWEEEWSEAEPAGQADGWGDTELAFSEEEDAEQLKEAANLNLIKQMAQKKGETGKLEKPEKPEAGKSEVAGKSEMAGKVEKAGKAEKAGAALQLASGCVEGKSGRGGAEGEADGSGRLGGRAG